MSRITLNDTFISALVKIVENNPGAVVALEAIYKNTERIDPQNIIGGMGVLLSLDTYEIYGTEIYILYNDKCGKDIRRMLLLLRATQLGLFSRAKLKTMAEDQEYRVNLSEEEWDKLDSAVCKQLSDFAEKENL